MDYYQPVRDQFIHKAMYPVEHRKDFFPKGPAPNETIKIEPKAPCAPKFVSKIEGNAVEESARVFFEGIVDSQPQPIFTWYFEDEEIFPGEAGWEEAEIHHSRKMSTLILKYVREHHMGKYSLVAQNRLGHAICNCDLIVRKKQFPPVFWQRLYSYEGTSGARFVAEVEVGGWPLPELTWYKDDEVIASRTHTENYNGYPNKYVPDRKIEIKRIDQIRHCIIFHRVNESDSGTYTVKAVNPLGEAVCEAQFVIEPGEGGGDDLYLPEKWKTGNRLTWKMEDERRKPFVGFKEPELTSEDMADMAKRFAGAPLPRAVEYFASLPPYKPTPMSKLGLLDMPFSADSGLKNVEKKSGKKGGQASKPSKFIPGQIHHRGYTCDQFGRILPIWTNPLDRNAPDPNSMAYKSVPHPDYDVKPRPARGQSPPCPHVWETHETIDRLYEMLKTVGLRLDLSAIRSDKLGSASQMKRQQPQQPLAHLHEQVHARKQVMNTVGSNDAARREWEERLNHDAARREWEERLNHDAAGAMANAQDFTSAFVQQMYSQQELEEPAPEPAPSAPPKAQIMSSHSRNLTSPKEMVDSAEYIPVKEKARLIAQQQEELEMRHQEDESAKLKGGVRILPPSPITVRKEEASRQEAYGQTTVTTRTMTTTSNFEHYESFGSMEQRVVQQQSSSTGYHREIPDNIPVLEDKYNVAENLDELGADEDEDDVELVIPRPESVASEESRLTQHTQQSVLSSSVTMGSSVSRASQSVQGSERSLRTMQDSSYSTASFVSQRGQDGAGDVQLQWAGGRAKQEQGDMAAGAAGATKQQKEVARLTESPSAMRRVRLMQPSQSPKPVEDDRVRYRSPPTEPFQPAFYRTPADNLDKNINPEFKLPSQRVKTSTDAWFSSAKAEHVHERDTEF